MSRFLRQDGDFDFLSTTLLWARGVITRYYQSRFILCYATLFQPNKMTHADRIRVFGKEKYVLPASHRKEKRFSIRVGDVVRELKLTGRAPAVCSALKTGEFLRSNNLKLVDTSGPKSGQSTTVVYTYEFTGAKHSSPREKDSWSRLRGALKGVFAELGGGEAYLRAERTNFYPSREDE